MRRLLLWYFKHPGPGASIRRRVCFGLRLILAPVVFFAGFMWLAVFMHDNGQNPFILIYLGMPVLIAVLVGLFITLFLRMFTSASRHLREARNTPTSRIRSAAQGYVELSGTLMVPPDGTRLLSPRSKTPCVWWEYTIAYSEQSQETSQSTEPFYLMDSSGICAIHPQGAIITEHISKKWQDNTHDYIERLLLPGKTCYVLGHFHTRNGQHQVEQPADGRPFLLSGESEAKVITSTRTTSIASAILVGILIILGVWFIAGWFG